MEATLEATARDSFGKNEARRTRRDGKVPAVLYGGDGKGATPISVAPKALSKILHSEAGQNTLIALKLAGGGDARVLVKDFQLDPITHEILHADFYRVAMDRVLEVTIPVIVHGEPKGVKQQGGIVEFIRRDIATSPKWKPVTEGEAMLVHVIMPKAEEVAAPAEAVAAAATATPAEPEVIKKGKKEEAEEEKKEDKKK